MRSVMQGMWCWLMRCRPTVLYCTVLYVWRSLYPEVPRFSLHCYFPALSWDWQNLTDQSNCREIVWRSQDLCDCWLAWGSKLDNAGWAVSEWVSVWVVDSRPIGRCGRGHIKHTRSLAVRDETDQDLAMTGFDMRNIVGSMLETERNASSDKPCNTHANTASSSSAEWRHSPTNSCSSCLRDSID